MLGDILVSSQQSVHEFDNVSLLAAAEYCGFSFGDGIVIVFESHFDFELIGEATGAWSLNDLQINNWHEDISL
ncbi:hypothetical protein D3C79_914700 [compost metagenome]